ncbi:MAG: putative protease, partial [Bacteriovoracaceae bacterium]
LNQIVNSGLDGIIVQDLGVFDLVKKHFPSLDIHASTQMTTHNEGQILFLNKIGATRVNLSRELNLDEIKSLTSLAHENSILTEVFVHGALCIAFSGQCYSSSVSVGNSGNRGRCSQACRDEYEITAAGNKYPLNLKDNSAYFDLPELVDAKVDSLKVEGRIKGAHYVYTVIDSWRKQINSFVDSGKLIEDDSNLHKVFNRSFTNSFLKGNLTKDMFIDSPRDYSKKHAIDEASASSPEEVKKVKKELFEDRNALGASLSDKIKDLHIEKPKLSLSFKAKLGSPFIISAITEEKTYEIKSSVNLTASVKNSLTTESLKKRFNSFNDASYMLVTSDFSSFDEGLIIPFREITQMKNRLGFLLNGSQEVVPPVDLPKLSVYEKVESKPKLSYLISDERDIHLLDKTDADIYFKIPESLKKDDTYYKDLFLQNPRLIPWFPAVMIGKDYLEAVKILEVAKPSKIITNNTGVAYKAYELGIEWIAGPLLNTTNSYALNTLKEELNCSGAFISNEINRNQIKKIRRPKDFRLLYSIYHPILLMTSRQCFFQRTVGCNKPSIDASCMLSCEKATTITNVKGISFAVDKQKGGYPSIYNHEQFLNIEAMKDFNGLFDEFFIDLTDIGIGSKERLDKELLIQEFEKALNNINTPTDTLKRMIPISTNAQYVQGL